eukprot:6189968-Pleurochrysis_carterae.AAC.1
MGVKNMRRAVGISLRYQRQQSARMRRLWSRAMKDLSPLLPLQFRKDPRYVKLLAAVPAVQDHERPSVTSRGYVAGAPNRRAIASPTAGSLSRISGRRA